MPYEYRLPRDWECPLTAGVLDCMFSLARLVAAAESGALLPGLVGAGEKGGAKAGPTWADVLFCLGFLEGGDRGV